MQAQMPIIRDIIYGATLHGGDFNKMCNELELDPESLNDSDRMVPFKPAAEVWNVAVAYTKDPLLGLHLGEELNPTILGMVGYLMQSSKTLYEAFIMLCKYNELFSTMLKYSMEASGDIIIIYYDPAHLWHQQYPESARQSVEISMAGVVKLFKTLSGKRIYPIRVELGYPAREVNEYERVFKTGIQFNSVRNSLAFRKRDMDLPVISYDKSLFELFTNTLDQKYKSLRDGESFSNRLKQMMLKDFKGRTLTIEIAASHQGMTVRTLQRKLEDEHTSYRDIINSLKKEIAQSLMSQAEFRIGEVAEMLGYSDSSAFRKATKKWGLA